MGSSPFGTERQRRGYMQDYVKVYSKRFPNVFLTVIPGHFMTPNSHINHYIDMTTMKSRQSEARATAEALAFDYVASTVVDTIICMDNSEVIGAYLADELTRHGIQSMNHHKTMYIMTPEYDSYGQMIFRDNVRKMIKDKHVLLLLASTTTGKTLRSAIEGIRYYGGEITGVSAIFSTVDTVAGMPIHRLFSKEDVPEYITASADRCPMCKEGMPIDAICNGFGYSTVNS